MEEEEEEEEGDFDKAHKLLCGSTMLDSGFECGGATIITNGGGLDSWQCKGMMMH